MPELQGKTATKTKSEDSSTGGTSSDELAESALMKKKQEQLWNDIEDSSLDEEESNSESSIDLSVAPFGDEGPSFSLDKKSATVSYNVPGTGFKFPPGGKFEESIGLDIPLPIPGVYIALSAGLEGGVEIPELAMQLSVSEEEVPKNEDYSKVDIVFSLANGDALQATFGGNVRLGVKGGVPLVAAVEAGVEAATEAKIFLSPKISGKGEYIYDSEGNLSTSKVNLGVEMAAGAGLEASLSLYLAGQLLMFKGDLYKLTLVSKDIAQAKGGAIVSRTWDNGNKGPIEIDPIFEKYFVAESWFEGMFKSEKLDQATAKMVNAQYDVYALEDLKNFLKLGTQQGQTASAAVRIAMSNFRAAETEHIKLQETLEAETDTKKKGQIRKDLKKLKAKIVSANKEWSKAQEAFFSKKSIDNVDLNLEKAQKSLTKVQGANFKLMKKELDKLSKTHASEREELLKNMSEANQNIEELNKRLELGEMSESYHRSLSKEATKTKAKAETDFQLFQKMYAEKQAKIHELMEAPSKDPLDQK